MLNVKKYRATTTRGALEKIKLELGEDAFVLDTKRVRTGGFLGLRSKMEVEVSAAAASSIAFRQPMKKNEGLAEPSRRPLHLTDDALAMPHFDAQVNEKNKENIMFALAARAASAADFEGDVLPPAAEIELGVEISSDAPSFVHPIKDVDKKQIMPEAKNSFCGENALLKNSTSEIDLLRAEVREVKFSLGAFANRQNAVSRQNAVDLGLFGKTFDSAFYDVYVELTATGMLPDLARKFVTDIIPAFRDTIEEPAQLTRATLLQAVSSSIIFEDDVLQGDKAAILAVIGATGVGKTTTAAKLAARVSVYDHRRVELVTLDTYRIAAVEQLKTYAEIIGAGCHVVRSVFELDAVLRRLPSDATVLIDTTGRSPHDLADQYELSGYLQERGDIRKCLVVQATTHSEDSAAAIKKFEMYGADCLAITKMDETMRPGAVIETISESNLPLAYFCTGQRVPEDLQVATAESFTNRILGNKI